MKTRFLSAVAVVGLIVVAAVALQSPPQPGDAVESQTVNKVVLEEPCECEECDCEGVCDGGSKCCVDKACCSDGDCCSEQTACADGKCETEALACSCDACECDGACDGESCCADKTCCADGACCKSADDDLPAGIIDLGIDLTPKEDTT